jgi:hypothetical protein
MTSPDSIIDYIVNEPLYDTEVLMKDSTYHQVNFFVRPLGQKMNSGMIKSYPMTNLRHAGMLGEPSQFSVVGFQLRVANTFYVNESASKDELISFMRTLHGTAVLEFGLSGRVMCTIPVSEIPGYSNIWNGIATVNTGAWETTNYFHTKLSDGLSDARVPHNKKYILIDSCTSIICRLVFEPELQPERNWVLQVRLVGERLKPVG